MKLHAAALTYGPRFEVGSESVSYHLVGSVRQLALRDVVVQGTTPGGIPSDQPGLLAKQVNGGRLHRHGWSA